jgi:hypothetical protein
MSASSDPSHRARAVPTAGDAQADQPPSAATATGAKRPSSRAGRSLQVAMGTIVAASAAPYGYTISIWSSGAVLMNSHGTPHVAEVFAFVAGALIGFGLMGLFARGGLTRAEPNEHAPDRVLAGAMHWLAAGAAVGAAALVARIGGWEAWPLAAFAATAIYILGASVQLALVTRRRDRLTTRRGR